MPDGPELTSPKSARVIEVRHLHDRRHRARRGAFVVEGPQALEAALRSRRELSDLYVAPSAAARHGALVATARRAGARVTVATDEVLAAMSETRQPQGLVAICPLVTVPWSQIAEAPASEGPELYVVLDRVNDPGNAGTIIRSADACGATAVVLTPGSVDPHNGKCVRASAGSLFHVPLAVDVPLAEAVRSLRARGAHVMAAAGTGNLVLGTPQATAALSGSVAWAMGREAQGLGESERSLADETVAIPMYGGAESFNLAAAAAICLYATAQAQRAT